MDSNKFAYVFFISYILITGECRKTWRRQAYVIALTCPCIDSCGLFWFDTHWTVFMMMNLFTATLLDAVGQVKMTEQDENEQR